MEPFTIKRGDTLPALEATLENSDGPVDITGGTVAFRLWSIKNTGTEECPVFEPNAQIFSKAGVVVTPAAGAVKYVWADGDTDIVGQYFGEFVVTLSGKTQSFPTAGFIPVSVRQSLKS